MSTFRVNKNVNYTVMSNHHLQDKRLSLKAKGLLSYMLSLPDDWDYSLKGLTVGCKDGLDSVRTAVLELEEHGYVRRQKVRNAKGQIIDYDYQVYESPVEDAPAVPGKEGGPSNPSASKSPKSRMKPCSSPFLDFPNLAEPNLEKATQQNTNKQNTKRQSTNLSRQTDESADFDRTALSGVDESLYEAAKVDGAGPVRIFFSITLPEIKLPLFYTTIMTTTGAFNVWGQPVMLTNGGPNYQTQVLLMDIRNLAFPAGPAAAGMASAMALLLGIILMAIAAIQLIFMNKED